MKRVHILSILFIPIIIVLMMLAMAASADTEDYTYKVGLYAGTPYYDGVDELVNNKSVVSVGATIEIPFWIDQSEEGIENEAAEATVGWTFDSSVVELVSLDPVTTDPNTSAWMAQVSDSEMLLTAVSRTAGDTLPEKFFAGTATFKLMMSQNTTIQLSAPGRGVGTISPSVKNANGEEVIYMSVGHIIIPNLFSTYLPYVER